MQVPRTLIFLSVTLLLIAGGVSASEPAPPAINPAAPQAIQLPVLKWQRGGCYDSWCETSWYSSPAVADVDDDGNLDVVLNTAHSGIVAYKLPGTSQARILWGTGRGNYQRTGSFVQSSLEGSRKSVQPTLPASGDTLTYTIRLYNPGPAMPGVRVTDTIPSNVHYLGDVWASAGSYGEADGVITWSGTVSASMPITITFGDVWDLP